MTTTPPSERKLPLDPAWIALAVAAAVLLLALSWLMGTDRPRTSVIPPVTTAPAPAAPPVAAAPTALDLATARIGATLDAALARIATVEATLAETAARPPGDPEALAALDRRIAEAGSSAEAALTRRLAALETALTGSMAGATRTREAAEQALVDRLSTVAREAQERLAAAERALGARMTATEQARSSGEQNLTQRLNTLETAIGQRLDALEQGLAQRLAPLEQALRRLAAAEARTERLTTIDALRSLLDAGRPLGAALPRLGTAPPAALTRFATTAPPTEPALRLAFEEAIRSARAAQAEGVRPRLNTLLTIRRGEEVVWGDASEAQIERARRALDAGDLDGALTHLGRLPESNRQALIGWIGEAEGLAAARAALRALSEG